MGLQSSWGPQGLLAAAPPQLRLWTLKKAPLVLTGSLSLKAPALLPRGRPTGPRAACFTAVGQSSCLQYKMEKRVGGMLHFLRAQPVLGVGTEETIQFKPINEVKEISLGFQTQG